MFFFQIYYCIIYTLHFIWCRLNSPHASYQVFIIWFSLPFISFYYNVLCHLNLPQANCEIFIISLHFISLHYLFLYHLKLPVKILSVFFSSSLALCCFLRQETVPHIFSLHPGAWNGSHRHTAGGNPVLDQRPIQRGVAILSVASCYRNWVVGLLVSCATLPFFSLFHFITSFDFMSSLLTSIYLSISYSSLHFISFYSLLVLDSVQYKKADTLYPVQGLPEIM